MARGLVVIVGCVCDCTVPPAVFVGVVVCWVDVADVLVPLIVDVLFVVKVVLDPVDVWRVCPPETVFPELLLVRVPHEPRECDEAFVPALGL